MRGACFFSPRKTTAFYKLLLNQMFNEPRLPRLTYTVSEKASYFFWHRTFFLWRAVIACSRWSVDDILQFWSFFLFCWCYNWLYLESLAFVCGITYNYTHLAIRWPASICIPSRARVAPNRVYLISDESRWQQYLCLKFSSREVPKQN